MTPPAPTLSIVYATRNDDNGGSPSALRLAASLDALAFAARLHRLAVEAVVVEWNPLPDRGRLHDVLLWPDALAGRIVTVPPDIAASSHAADPRIPVLEYAAKNVGIRRARASWILTTNPDDVLSGELAAALAATPLVAGYFYRARRADLSAPDGNGHTTIMQIHDEHDGAGDFLLLSAADWSRLEGFPEDIVTAGHLDSYLVALANAAGLTQRTLAGPLYHQWHSRDDASARPQMAWPVEDIRRPPQPGWGLAGAALPTWEAGGVAESVCIEGASGTD